MDHLDTVSYLQNTKLSSCNLRQILIQPITIKDRVRVLGPKVYRTLCTV